MATASSDNDDDLLDGLDVAVENTTSSLSSAMRWGGGVSGGANTPLRHRNLAKIGKDAPSLRSPGGTSMFPSSGGNAKVERRPSDSGKRLKMRNTFGISGLDRLKKQQKAWSERTSDAFGSEVMGLVPGDRLLIVSNRLPLRFVELDEGSSNENSGKKEAKLKVEMSAGGIASSLRRTHANMHRVEPEALPWIGWTGITTADGSVQGNVADALKELGMVGVGMTPDEYESFYEIISNRCLWPLFHYFTDQVTFTWKDWEVYESVNRKFADAILRIAKDGDVIMVQDYHLCLVPKMLRESKKDLRIGFFLHVPFPSSEIYQLLPSRVELLEGLLGADLISMHTFDYVRHFRTSLMRLLGLESRVRRVQHQGREVLMLPNPIGLDIVEWERRSRSEEVRKELERFKHTFGGRRLILGVDRLDYTKGIPKRLEAFSTFLDQNPEVNKTIVMLQIAVPSREGVDEYVELKHEVDRTVGRINGLHGSVGHQPLHYLYQSVSQNTLCALYQLADVALITPLRDGLNLVAKEYVASRLNDDGVLILGECVGAAFELGDALRVNPFDERSMVNALKRAITMSPSEQKHRMKSMRRIVKRNNIETWLVNLLEGVQSSVDDLDYPDLSRPGLFVGKNRQAWNNAWVHASHRNLYLDYDGTLREFCNIPDEATPTYDLMVVLEKLCSRSDVSVWIVSGRGAEFLMQHFGHLKIGLIAEHGATLKWPTSSQFDVIYEDDDDSWKDAVFDSMEQFADFVPGSFIEAKTYGLAWHYRKAFEQGRSRWHARQFRVHLVEMLAGMPLHVKRGKCVLEVVPIGISKDIGILTAHEKFKMSHPNGGNNDVMSVIVGDDITDEDAFKIDVLENSLSLLVGNRNSNAMFRLQSPSQTRMLLSEWAHLLPEVSG